MDWAKARGQGSLFHVRVSCYGMGTGLWDRKWGGGLKSYWDEP